MIAEISAVVGILKALNEGISTVKESGSHLTGLTGVFDGLTKSKAAVEQIESEVNEGNHIITQEEALQLAWAKNDIREKEKRTQENHSTASMARHAGYPAQIPYGRQTTQREGSFS